MLGFVFILFFFFSGGPLRLPSFRPAVYCVASARGSFCLHHACRRPSPFPFSCPFLSGPAAFLLQFALALFYCRHISLPLIAFWTWYHLSATLPLSFPLRDGWSFLFLFLCLFRWAPRQCFVPLAAFRRFSVSFFSVLSCLFLSVLPLLRSRCIVEILVVIRLPSFVFPPRDRHHSLLSLFHFLVCFRLVSFSRGPPLAPFLFGQTSLIRPVHFNILSRILPGSFSPILVVRSDFSHLTCWHFTLRLSPYFLCFGASAWNLGLFTVFLFFRFFFGWLWLPLPLTTIFPSSIGCLWTRF